MSVGVVFAGFAAGAATTVVTIARGFGFASQGFQFIPGLNIFALECFREALAFLVFEQHRDLVAHRQDVHHLAFALWRNDTLVAFGKFLASLHVLLVFIDQTTAQTSAHAGDLIRRERNALFLGHLDGDRTELRQEHGAAALFQATGAHATDDLGHVARTDLPQLDVSGLIKILHILLKRLQINFLFALSAEEEGETRTIVVVFSRHDLDALELQFGGAGAAIDHRFGLLGLPGLEQQQIPGRGASFHGPPAAFRFSGRFLQELDDFAQMPATGCIYNDVLTDSHIGDSAGIRNGKSYRFS